jgi:hypothetical protein
MARVLDDPGSSDPMLAIRLVRAVATRSAERDEVLLRHIGHRDRELGLVVMERLGAPDPAPDSAAAAIDHVMQDEIRHAVWILACLSAMATVDAELRQTDEPLQRALRDEFDLGCQRVKAGLRVRYGIARLGPPLVELEAGGSNSALAVEALEVLLSPTEAKQVLGLLQPDRPATERLTRLPPPVGDVPTDPVDWLRDLVEDADDRWRSPWLRATAVYAAKGRHVLEQLDLDAARALGDPTIDELMD